MNQKFVIIGIIIAVGVISFSILYPAQDEKITLNSETPKLLENITPINISQQGPGKVLFTRGNSIFETFVFSGDAQNVNEDGSIDYKHGHFLLKPENEKLYRDIGIAEERHNSVIVAPIFTITAYDEPGFYNYFRGECDISCINDIPIKYETMPTFQSSGNAFKVLRLLGYPYITDIEIDKNPEILNLFDKVILLHNEYVTKKEFVAITQHPKVMYLYPNALYAEINVNYEKDTISLVRGHGYPEPEIKNGFDWEFDNTVHEYNTDCNNWQFSEIKNGIMLNCYPENIIFQDRELLKAIKEY